MMVLITAALVFIMSAVALSDELQWGELLESFIMEEEDVTLEPWTDGKLLFGSSDVAKLPASRPAVWTRRTMNRNLNPGRRRTLPCWRLQGTMCLCDVHLLCLLLLFRSGKLLLGAAHPHTSQQLLSSCRSCCSDRSGLIVGFTR